MGRHAEVTDKESQNAADDDEFVHRNWMTDRRIAGMICLIPGLLMISSAVPLADLSSFHSVFVGCIVDPNSIWHSEKLSSYGFLNIAAFQMNMATMLYIGGALVSVWCLKIILKIAAR